jgi:phage shock protein PspC (stress-responsive transcriptional regulator)
MEKRLQRDEHNKMIAGVCAGLADYLNIDITLVRAAFVLAMVLHGCGLGVYIILWIVMPKKIYDFNRPGFNNAGLVDYTVPPQGDGPIDYSVPNPFGGFTPPQQQGAPFVMPPKKKSNGGIIVGIALVAFGSFFLLDNFDLLPDWEFHRLWPLIFVVGGLLLMFSRKKQDPWEKEDWNTTEEQVAETKAEDKTEDTPPAV